MWRLGITRLSVWWHRSMAGIAGLFRTSMGKRGFGRRRGSWSFAPSSGNSEFRSSRVRPLVRVLYQARLRKNAGWKPAQLLQALNGFECEGVEAVAAFGYVVDDLFEHAGFPERFEVIGNAGDGLVVRVAGKKQGDLVRHVDHVFLFHVQSSAGRRAQSLAVDSFSICVVRRRVSR